MDQKIFRTKSIDRISSPEQLTDYVRVSTPGVWVTLAAIIALLIGACVWGICGKMDTSLSTVAVIKQGRALCYVKEEAVREVLPGQTARIEGQDYRVVSVASAPGRVTADMDAYALHLGQLSVGEWVYEVALDAELNDGVYRADIVTESVRPMSFLVK